MYGKLFESMYDGTLVEDWRALVTFQQMIILSDADGTVDITPSSLSRRTGIPIEHIEAGIKVLESDDPSSRSPELNGRRIVLLDEVNRTWGWSIVNHEKYKLLQNTEQRREKERSRKRKQREKESMSQAFTESMSMSHNVTDGHSLSAMSLHEDKDKDEDELKEMSVSHETDWFEKFWEGYRRKEKKKESLKLFNRLTEEKQQLAIKDSVSRYAHTDKDFIPLPPSYLNGERWNDEAIEDKYANDNARNIV